MASRSCPVEIDGKSDRPRPVGKRLALGLGLIFAALSIPGGFLLRPFYSDNLSIVDPGRVIRSAQPTGRLPAMIAEYRLASILNLRGGSARDWWYTAEVQETERHGVEFYDLPLGATRRPTRKELLLLIDVLRKCRYPLLIHCKSGADRTGLATAVYRMVALDEAPDQALGAFSIYHSHVPLFGPERLHEPIEEYAAWLASRRLPHSSARFRDWVKNEYRADDPREEPPDLYPGPRHRS